MTDKDFETQSENAAELLTNDGYFARYRQHLSEGISRREAWEATEKDLPLGGRRFLSFTAFKNALTLERSGKQSATIRLQFDKVT